ncbi:MAG: hypothetical protein KDI48_13155, partial [Xanthomonadales bacterium]|nr:hypothetical protein [Xanthomonadales bacterium]
MRRSLSFLILLLALFMTRPASATPLTVTLSGPSNPTSLGFVTSVDVTIRPTAQTVPTTNLSAEVRTPGFAQVIALQGHNCPGTLIEVHDGGAAFRWTGLGNLSGTAQISCTIDLRLLRLGATPLLLQLACDQCSNPANNRAEITLTAEAPPDLAGRIDTNPFPTVGPATLTLSFANEGAGLARNVNVGLFGPPALFANMVNAGTGHCTDGYVLGSDFASIAIVQMDPGESVSCRFDFVIPAAGSYPLNLLISADSAAGLPDPWPDNNSDQVTLQTADLTVNTRFSPSPDSNPGDGQCADGNGACSIRAAIEESNALPGYQRINIPYQAGGYFLGGVAGALQITDPVLLNGAADPASGARPWITRNDGDDASLFRIATDSPTQTVFHGLELRGNPLLLSVDGAIISQSRGALWLRECTLSGGRTTGQGGALRGTEGLRVTGVEFFDNQAATGGAIALFGVFDGVPDALIEDSVFDDNRAQDGTGNGGIGGALYLFRAQVDVLRTALTNNRATGNQAGQGGAVFIATQTQL